MDYDLADAPVYELSLLSRRLSLVRSWIELETKRESLLQVLDEDANFGGHLTARRPHGKDWHCSFKRSEKTYNCTLSEFCSEEPCWRLSNPQMFKDPHPHLFNIAGSKDSCGNYMLHGLARPKAPRLYGTSLDINDRSKAVEILRRFRCTVACEVLRSGDENGHGLP